jgi:hypothetical protein
MPPAVGEARTPLGLMALESVEPLESVELEALEPMPDEGGRLPPIG